MAPSRRLRWEVADARGRRVVFVSHCLLDQNVRYPGGATCAGAVPDLVGRYLDAGIGLCQMPCPEQRAWGGVAKPYLRMLYGRRVLRWRIIRQPTLAVGTAWTRVVYRRLAARVARDVAEYLDAGCEVVEIVGVGGSPSCGVWSTLDIDRSVAAMARAGGDTDARAANRDIVAANVVAGSGLFVRSLDRALRFRGLVVRHREHDLLTELHDAGAVDR